MIDVARRVGADDVEGLAVGAGVSLGRIDPAPRTPVLAPV